MSSSSFTRSRHLEPPRPSNAKAGAAGDVVVALRARDIVIGICFHVVEDRLALRVEAGSAERAVKRLDRDRVVFQFERSQWIRLTNAERLKLLLAASRTEIAIGPDGIATLRRSVG